MDPTARSSSFLPSIKCSNCNASIEISLMGDHVCSNVPLPDSRLQVLHSPFAVPASNPSNGPALMKSRKMPRPSRINASVGSNEHPLRPPNQFSPRSSSSHSRSASPVSYGNGPRSTYRSLPRSATSPLPSRPTSPDISLPQDCAFPPFPMSKPRSATPTTPSEIKRPFTPGIDNTTTQAESSATFAPFSPQGNGGGSVLQRMNTIAPGPFNVRDKGESRHPGLKRTVTMSSSEDYTRPSSGGGNAHVQRPSTSSSNYTRNPSLSSISGGPRSTIDRGRFDMPAVPALPIPGRPSTGYDDLVSPNENPQQDHSVIRSQTYPTDERTNSTADSSMSIKGRRPSAPTRVSHKVTPSVAAANRPLEEIGSTSFFKPNRSMRGRANSVAPDKGEPGSSRSTSRTGTRSDQRPEDAPPLPLPTRAQGFSIGNPYHTPTESTSSNESSGSDAKSGSSRSTPPLPSSPQQPKRRSSDIHQGTGIMEAFQNSMSITPAAEEPTSRRRGPPPSFSRPMYSRPMDSPPRREPALLAPDVRTDPAIQSGRPPIGSPRESFRSEPPLNAGNLQVSPAPPAQSRAPLSPARGPTTASKGNCRGCGEPIKGKSVSSKDGQLSGRYHRDCFVCKTCRAPFPTADFYVLGNHPYCNRHYHQLNGSLCKHCDRGIEGQYVETDAKQKCHPHCFTCQDCHKILRDDYFEMNGRTYCEQHAYRAAQQTSMLGPGRRHPERRTTRLMMM